MKKNLSMKPRAHRETSSVVHSSDYELYDCKRRPIRKGDVIKVFHYIAALRRKRCYMYKHVIDVRPKEDFPRATCPWMTISHLDGKGEVFHQPMDGRVMSDWEIVQGFDEDGSTFEERPRRLPVSGK